MVGFARRDRGVAIGDELEQAAAPDCGAGEKLQPTGQDARALLLAHQRRREGEPHRLAIGLERCIAARAEQRRRIDAGRVELRAILLVGQEIVDDQCRVGVDAIGAGAGKGPIYLDVVVADRGRVAEVVARAPEIGRALVGERVIGVDRGEIGPDRLRRRAGIGAQAQFERRVDREVFPDDADAGVERRVGAPAIGPSHSAMMRSAV